MRLKQWWDTRDFMSLLGLIICKALCFLLWIIKFMMWTSFFVKYVPFQQTICLTGQTCFSLIRLRIYKEMSFGNNEMELAALCEKNQFQRAVVLCRIWINTFIFFLIFINVRINNHCACTVCRYLNYTLYFVIFSQ